MEIEGDVGQKRTVIGQDIIYENVTYYLQGKKKWNTITSSKINTRRKTRVMFS